MFLKKVYSCYIDALMEWNKALGGVLSKYLQTAVAVSSTACNALNSGVLLSKASPVYATKTVGIHNVVS